MSSPGPWNVVDGQYPCFREIVGPSFKISIVMFATDVTLAQAMLREADAQLIAAAPDLLALLRESQENIGGNWRARRDAAIAKALGHGN